MEAARFFKKDIYESVDGYNESMVSGEDWDLSQRIEAKGKIGRINSLIKHNEGELKLLTTLKKKFYYAKQFAKYSHATTSEKIENQTSIVARYWLFLSQPTRLFRNPILGLGMLFMKTCEFGVGGVSYLLTPNEQAINNEPVHLNISDTGLPFVSYIIPTYNAEKYLKRCLDPVFMQDYPKDKYEVIIADGGSTDSTRDILKKYDVQLVENSKKIAEYGKFLAYKKSKGEFVVLLDADNIINSNDWLISLVSLLVQDGSLLGAESNYLIADDFSSINTYGSKIRKK
jgi:hypothetical protein